MSYEKILIISMFLLTGCATIVSDHNYSVQVTGQEPDVDFTVKNRKGNVVSKGTTPTIINLESASGYFSGEKYTFETSKNGFANGIAILSSSVSAWYIAGNFGFGSWIGWLVVDPLSGAMYNLPTNIFLPLGPKIAKIEPKEEIKTVPLERLYLYQDNTKHSKPLVTMKEVSENDDCIISFYIDEKKAADFMSGESSTFYIDEELKNIKTFRSLECVAGENKKIEIMVDSNETKKITIK